MLVRVIAESIWSALESVHEPVLISYASLCDNHKRGGDKRIGADTMQNLGELQLKPGTLERYSFMPRVELMIVGVAHVLHRWGGH